MPQRLAWLDWQRGLAVLLMIEVHVLNAWIAPAAAQGGLYRVLHMAGGFAAPGFLFMAGLSQVLADASMLRRGLSPRARLRTHVERALYLLGVAYAFRVLEFASGLAFTVPGGWQTLFKVDILNIIALGLLGSALLVVALGPRPHLIASIGGAAFVVLITPLVADPGSGSTSYLFVRSGYGFGLCNWTAFVLAGGAVGRLMVSGVRAKTFLGLGALLLLVSYLTSALPAYQLAADSWGTSPSWFLTRLGATLVAAGLLQVVPALAEPGLAWLARLGRHSLLAYMASVELTYGLWLSRLHGRLSLPSVLVGMVGMTLATLALIWISEAFAAWRAERTAAHQTNVVQA